MLRYFFKFNKLKRWSFVAWIAVAQPAFAVELKPFDAPAFEKAEAAQKTIVLDYHADWCPSCRVQKPALQKVLQSKKFDEVVAFEVDFDHQPAELKKLVKVGSQSTIVVLKGKTIQGQETWITAPSDIEKLLDKGL